MKCAEVMEWMHRYLDQDLSRDEIIEMFRHIDICPSCAEVFERLSALSKQLEELPDVKAPFSLVDSILPQLEELDRAARDQSATRSEEHVVVPFSDEKSRRKTSRGASIASRTGIGAAAAAILLGIAIFNMPDKLPGAEVERSLQSKSTELSNEVADIASGSQHEAEDTANESDQLNTADSGFDAGGSPESAAASGPDYNDSSADIAVPNDPTEVPEESLMASSEPDPASRGRSASAPTEKPKVTESVKTPKQNPATKSPPEKPDSVKNDQSKQDKSDQGVVADPGKGSTEDIAPTSPEESAIKIPYPYEQGTMSHRSTDGSAVQTWTSPDSLYAAKLAGQQLVIFSNPPEGSVEDRIEVTTLPIDGNWVSGKWSPDSMQFTYVIELEGTYVTTVYDIQTKTSSSPSPAPSPAATTEVTPVITPAN